MAGIEDLLKTIKKTQPIRKQLRQHSQLAELA